MYSHVFSSFATAAEKKVITLYIHADAGKHRETVRNLLDKFNLQNPHIEANLASSRGVYDYTKSVEKWLEKGDGPDVFWWFGGGSNQ